MSKSSATQRKPAPRKSVPQSVNEPVSTRPQSSKSSSPKASAAKTSGKSQSGKVGKSQAVIKQRSSLLTAALALAVLGAIASLVLPLVYHKATLASNNSLLVGGAILAGLLGIAGVIGLWQWKRWGLYLFGFSALAAAALGFYAFPVAALGLLLLLPLVVLVFAITSEKRMPWFD